MRRTIAAFVSAATLLACGALPAAADDPQGGGPDQVVSAITTADNMVAERSKVHARSFGGDTLDNTNLARAYAHDCTGCRSVAVSIQAVFATGHPHTVTPHNFAVAVNENCTGCVSFAYAYQYVVTTDGPVRLTDAGRQQLGDLREQFAEAAHSDMAPADLDARLKDLSAQFKNVVDNELQAAGEDGHGSPHEDEDQQGDQQ